MSDITWKPVTLKLSELIPWERNPKTISKAHAKRLLANWQELGQWQTIAVGPAGEVYDGHQRLVVLRSAYGEEYQVQALQSSRALTEKERERFVVEAHAGAVGSWDWDNLANWSSDDLKGWGFDNEYLADLNKSQAALLSMLDEQKEIVDAEPQIDRAAELQEKWQTEIGQLWRIGEHRLLCGDSTKREDAERVIGKKKVNLIVTDPPYGVNYEGGANNAVKRERLAGDESAKLYKPFLIAAPINNHDCAIYLWHAGREAELVYIALRECGFTIRSQIIWNKVDAHYGAFMAQYKQKHETCLYAIKGSPEFIGATNECTVWDIKQSSRNENHPTEKPIELMERAIGNHPYDYVYDGFCGSGTTMVACQNLNRKCRAIEISPAYVAVCLERMSTAFPGIEIELSE